MASDRCIVCAGYEDDGNEIWNRCKKHQLEGERMNTCSKCGGETEYKTGISKKTGKQWAAFKCNSCENMDWTRPQSQSPKAPQASGTPPKQDLNSLEIRLIRIENEIKTLKNMFVTQFGAQEVVKEDEPF